MNESANYNEKIIDIPRERVEEINASIQNAIYGPIGQGTVKRAEIITSEDIEENFEGKIEYDEIIEDILGFDADTFIRKNGFNLSTCSPTPELQDGDLLHRPDCLDNVLMVVVEIPRLEEYDITRHIMYPFEIPADEEEWEDSPIREFVTNIGLLGADNDPVDTTVQMAYNGADWLLYYDIDGRNFISPGDMDIPQDYTSRSVPSHCTTIDSSEVAEATKNGEMPYPKYGERINPIHAAISLLLPISASVLLMFNYNFSPSVERQLFIGFSILALVSLVTLILHKFERRCISYIYYVDQKVRKND